jgi:hypothetical protein
MLGTATGVFDASTGVFLKPADAYTRGRNNTTSPHCSRTSDQDSIRTNVTSRTPSADMTPSSDSLVGNRPSYEITNEHSRDPNSTTTAHGSSSVGSRVAGDMALASGKSFVKIFSTYTKGLLVDAPLATAEGFRGMPQLWGSEVKQYGKVQDWKSGGIVAGKSLIQGIGDGLCDLVIQPIKGGQKGGAWGATKGVAKGTASLVTKTVSGGIGLVAYPGQGIAKSLHTLFHSDTSKDVLEARRAEGKWMAERLSSRERLVVANRYFDMQQRA